MKLSSLILKLKGFFGLLRKVDEQAKESPPLRENEIRKRDPVIETEMDSQVAEEAGIERHHSHKSLGIVKADNIVRSSNDNESLTVYLPVTDELSSEELLIDNHQKENVEPTVIDQQPQLIVETFESEESNPKVTEKETLDSAILIDPNEVNIIDKDGNTILMKSAIAGDLRKAKRALELGANPNQQNKSGATAIILATRAGHINIVDLLVHSGADIHLKTNLGLNAMDIAIKKDNMEIVRVLRKATHINPIKETNRPKVIKEDQPKDIVVVDRLPQNPITLHKQNKADQLTQFIKGKIPEQTKLKFDGFYHMTHMNNAASIIKEGRLYCRAKNHMNVDMAQTLETTSSVLNNTGFTVKNYSRLYFRPLTPTYYYFQKSGAMVLLRFSEQLIGSEGAMFSVGNAGKYTPRILPVSIGNIKQLDFDLLFMSSEVATTDYEKDLRHTELLIPNYVSIRYLKEVYFMTKLDLSIFSETYGLASDIKYSVNLDKFFQEARKIVL